jgi:hypothetical protein
MSYKEPLASTADFGIMKVSTGLLVSNGTVSTNPVALFDQAYFYSTVTQTNPVSDAL